jgi:ribosomal protein S18 acetylase RimI-like enzyme
MNIRFLNSDDAAEYWRLRMEALQTDPQAFSSSAEEHRLLPLDEVRRRIGAEGTDMLIVGAFEPGSLVGTAGFYREKGPKSRHKGRIWGVYVTPGARGKGVARQLLRKLLEHAAQFSGIEQILISVTSTQTAARSLYRSLGFELFGCEPRALKLGEDYLDEDHMIVRLGSGTNS